MKSLTLSLTLSVVALVALAGCTWKQSELDLVDNPPKIAETINCNGAVPSASGNLDSPQNWRSLVERLERNLTLRVAFDKNDGAIVVSLVQDTPSGLAIRLVGTTVDDQVAATCTTGKLKELNGELFFQDTPNGELQRVPTRMLAEDRIIAELANLLASICQDGLCPSSSSDTTTKSMLDNTRLSANALLQEGHGIYFVAYSVADQTSILGLELYDEETFMMWMYFLQNPQPTGASNNAR
jgi:hypothetical protein